MRSLPILKTTVASVAYLALTTGCLISEEPLLDEKSGRSAPLGEGPYLACEQDEGDMDCDRVTVSRLDDGAYAFDEEDGARTVLRFRRIAKGGYAVQLQEDDIYAYYYGAGGRDEFSLALMLCDALPVALRQKLISKGDLSSEDEAFDVCFVHSRSGLVAAAKAYHRGEAANANDQRILLTPASGEDLE